MSVERLELSTNGLKGHYLKNTLGIQRTRILSQSVGRVKKQVRWTPF